MWRFAEEPVLGTVDEDLALWEPSSHVCTVRHTAKGWVADWPDEEHPPIPDVTIAWVLWHIEWWWSDTISRVQGGPQIPPEAHRWSGDTSGVVAVKQRWDDILASADLDAPIDWVMPEPQPLWFVAAWVNVEFTKNLAEINHLRMLRANVSV